MSDVSDGLITASCPRCDLLFAVDMKNTLTDEEREAIEWYAGYGRDGLHADTLRKLLERMGGQT